MCTTYRPLGIVPGTPDSELEAEPRELKAG